MAKDLPFLKFNLKPGERRAFEHEGVHYTVGLDLFSEHDHEKYPLYYYPKPIEEENPNLFVLWIEDDANDMFRYNSPYTGSIEGSWFVCRFNVDLVCNKLKKSVRVWVYPQWKKFRQEFAEKMSQRRKPKEKGVWGF